jgi:hypothetical protein
MDQKANTVADIASVLAKIGTEEGKEIGLVAPLENVEVEVRWTNLLDAEFAPTWSDNVIHDRLETTMNHRPEDRPPKPKKLPLWKRVKKAEAILEAEQKLFKAERMERIRANKEQAREHNYQVQLKRKEQGLKNSLDDGTLKMK